MAPGPTSLSPGVGSAGGASVQSDRALLLDAERAAADTGLPSTLAGHRRRHLLGFDALSTTWSGWSVEQGTPVWLQVLRPRWVGHPTMVRRFVEARAPAGVAAFSPVDGAVLPTRVLRQPGTPLRELAPQPGEDPVCLPVRAAIFAHALAGLAAVHATGRGVGPGVADWVVVRPAGPMVVDRLPFAEPPDPERDLRELAAAVLALGPAAQDPLATLARTWAERAPPSAHDGGVLVARAMASHLAWLRHQLVRSRRSHTRGHRLGGLSRLLRRLEQVQAPPLGIACLATLGHDQQVLVESDGRVLRGGPVVAGHPRDLPLVWSADGGLDPVAGRLLLRAWAQCQGADRAAADAIQAALGPRAVAPTHFVRWLKAARRLRSGRLLLDAEARVRVLPPVR